MRASAARALSRSTTNEGGAWYAQQPSESGGASRRITPSTSTSSLTGAGASAAGGSAGAAAAAGIGLHALSQLPDRNLSGASTVLRAGAAGVPIQWLGGALQVGWCGGYQGGG